MRIGRTLPPAAAPINLKDIFYGLQGWLRGQSAIDRFQQELRDTFQVKHCFLLSSGKVALSIILQALHDLAPQRNEVVIPAFTCFSVPSAIRRAGLKIRLCDVNPATLDFNHDQLQQIVSGSNQILSIIPTHLFGVPADVEQVKTICKAQPEIRIVEDAAQAMGTRHNHQFLGTVGDLGFFSLGRGKSFSTVAGGVILTSADTLADAIRNRVQGLPAATCTESGFHLFQALSLSLLIHPSLFWIPKALPFLRLGETLYDENFYVGMFSSFQAGLAKGWRKRLSGFNVLRCRNFRFWKKQITEFSRKLSVPDFPDGADLPLLRFPVYIDSRKNKKKLTDASERLGLGIMPSYPTAISRVRELAPFFSVKDYPGADACADRLLTLPVHPLMNNQDNRKLQQLLASRM